MQRAISSILYNKAILVVDDDFASNLLLTEYLHPIRAELHSASSASQAFDIFISHPNIKLVLMDMRLGDCCGLSIAERMKKERPATKVIVQTALAIDEDRKRMEASCCDAFLFKPIDEAILYSTIHKVLVN